MNANSGEPWSEMDLWELKTSMKYRRSLAEVAGFLYREEEEGARHGEGAWPQRALKHWEKAAVGA